MFETQSTTWYADPALDGIIKATINEMSAVAIVLCVSFMALKIGYEWFNYSVNSINDSNYVGKWFDTNEIIRVGSMVLLLGIYPTLAESVTSGISYINDTTDKSSETKGKMEEISNAYVYEKTILPQKIKFQQSLKNLAAAKQSGDQKMIKAAQAIADQEGAKYSAELLDTNGTTNGRQDEAPIADDSFWGLMMGGIGNFFAVMLNMIFGAIAMAMKWVISGYARVLFKIMLCIGPLAIAFSVIWKDKFIYWFESLLNIGLVFLVLNILDILVSDYFYQALLGKNVDPGQALAFNLAIIGAYLTSFKLTGMIVGRTGINSAMNKSLVVAGAMVSAGIMGAASLGGGGKAGAGAAGAGSGNSSGGGTGGRMAKASINAVTSEAKKEE